MTALRKTPINEIVRPVASTAAQPARSEILSLVQQIIDDAEEREGSRIIEQLEPHFDALGQAFGVKICEAARGMLFSTIDCYVSMAPKRVQKREALSRAAGKQCLKAADALEAAWGGSKFVGAYLDHPVTRQIADLRATAAVHLRSNERPKKAGNAYKLRDELLLKGLAEFFYDYLGGNIGQSIDGPWVTFLRMMGDALWQVLPSDARPNSNRSLARRAKEMQPYFGEEYPKASANERAARALNYRLWLGSDRALSDLEEMIRRLVAEREEQPSCVKTAVDTVVREQTEITDTQQ